MSKHSNTSSLCSTLWALPFAALLAAPAAAQGFWEGPWIGAHVGMGSANHDFGGGVTYTGGPGWFPLTPGDVLAGVDWPEENARGGIAGLQVGYGFALTSNLIAGVQADLSFSRISYENGINLAPLFSSDFTMEPRRLLTLSARLGYLPTEDVQVYGLFGWSRASYRTNLETTVLGTTLPSDGESVSLSGMTFGGGVETRVGARTSIGIEYRFSNLGRHSFIDEDFSGIFGDSYNAEFGFDSRVHSVRLVLNYRF